MRKHCSVEEIVLATGNADKVREIRDILKDLPVRILSLADFPDVPVAVEDGATLEENAARKARTTARFLRKWALADDSGLEVNHLGGEPGVFSARWAGPGCTYGDNNRKLLAALEGVPKSKRGARFRSVIALASPAGRVWTVEGKIRGSIARTARGRQGFGYDPVFELSGPGKTFAEISSRKKNAISHRGRALRRAKALLRRILSGRVPLQSRD